MDHSLPPFDPEYYLYLTGDESIGDWRHSDQHSYHTHIHVTDPRASDPLTRAIQYAEDDLWDAEMVLVGTDRHRAVKAARDALRALRKREIRERFR